MELTLLGLAWACLCGAALGCVVLRERYLLVLFLTVSVTWNLLTPLFTLQSYLHPLGVTFTVVTLFVLLYRRKEIFEGSHFEAVVLFLAVLCLSSSWAPLRLSMPYVPPGLSGSGIISKILSVLYQFSAILLSLCIAARYAIPLLRGERDSRMNRYILSLLLVNGCSVGTLFHLSLSLVDFALLSPLAGYVFTIPLLVLWRGASVPNAYPVRLLMTSLLLGIPFGASLYLHYSFLIGIQNLHASWVMALLQAGIMLFLLGSAYRALRTIWMPVRLDALLRRAVAKGIPDHELLVRTARLLGRVALTRGQAWRVSELLNIQYPDALRDKVAGIVEALKKEAEHGS